MGRFYRISAALTAIAVVFAAVAVALAQAQGSQPAPGHMRVYDRATETTVEGTVTDVKSVTSMRGRPSTQGVHILVDTGPRTVDVHLGPAWYMQEHKVNVQAGDVVTVVGSRMTIGGTEAVIARRLDKSGTTWTFRDETGRPLWAAAGRGPRS